MFQRTLIVLEPDLPNGVAIDIGVALTATCAGEVVFYTGLPRPHLHETTLFAAEMAAAAALATDDSQLPRAQSMHREACRAAEAAHVLARSEIDNTEALATGIVRAAQTHACDVIVLVGDGTNALVRLLSGSVVPGLVTASTVPLLVCPSGPTPATAEPARNKANILIVLDGGDGVVASRIPALDLARQLAADVHFVHIRPAEVIAPLDGAGFVGGSSLLLDTDILAQSEQMLNAACVVAMGAGLRAQGQSLPAGTTAKEVARMASERSCDLIAVAHHGGNAVVRLLTGSLIPGLITAATTPLLIVPRPSHTWMLPAGSDPSTSPSESKPTGHDN